MINSKFYQNCFPESQYFHILYRFSPGLLTTLAPISGKKMKFADGWTTQVPAPLAPTGFLQSPTRAAGVTCTATPTEGRSVGKGGVIFGRRTCFPSGLRFFPLLPRCQACSDVDLGPFPLWFLFFQPDCVYPSPTLAAPGGFPSTCRTPVCLPIELRRRIVSSPPSGASLSSSPHTDGLPVTQLFMTTCNGQ